jgi:hypothetical protein
MTAKKHRALDQMNSILHYITGELIAGRIGAGTADQLAYDIRQLMTTALGEDA